MLSVEALTSLWPSRLQRVDVGADDLGDSPGEEIPDDDAAVVAAHGEQRAPAVEGAGQGHADAVQRAIGFLGVVLAEGLEQLQVHRGRRPAPSVSVTEGPLRGPSPRAALPAAFA